MNIPSGLSDDLIQDKEPITEHIHEIQSHLVNIALLIGAAISIPALFALCLHTVQFGWKTITFVQAGCVVLAWVTTLRRHHWSLHARIYVILLITFLLV